MQPVLLVKYQHSMGKSMGSLNLGMVRWVWPWKTVFLFSSGL